MSPSFSYDIHNQTCSKALLLSRTLDCITEILLSERLLADDSRVRDLALHKLYWWSLRKERDLSFIDHC